MKSYYFNTSSWTSDQTSEFKEFIEAEEKLFDKVMEWYSNQNTMPRFDRTVYHNLASGTQYDIRLIQSVLFSILRIFYIFNNKKNKYEDLVEDIKYLFRDSKLDENILSSRLERIYKLSDKFNTFILEEITEGSGISELESSSGSITLKPVFDEKYSYNEMKIENYNPKIIKYVPAIMIALKKTKSKENFEFQMAPDGFNRFLNDLLALQIELKKVIEYDGKK